MSRYKAVEWEGSEESEKTSQGAGVVDDIVMNNHSAESINHQNTI